MLGSLKFIASYDEGIEPFSDPAVRIRDLTLTFVAGNGDQLVIADHTTWLVGDSDPPRTRTVDQASSSGRLQVLPVQARTGSPSASRMTARSQPSICASSER
jgi:hypothetical protein